MNKLTLSVLVTSLVAASPALAFESYQRGDVWRVLNHLVEDVDAESFSRLRSKVVDLNEDGGNELIMRTRVGCVELACPTYIASTAVSGEWSLIGQFKSAAVDVENTDEGWARLVAEQGARGRELELYFDDGHYVVDLTAYGTSLEWREAEEAFAASGRDLDTHLQRALGQKALMLESMNADDDAVLLSAADLNGDEKPEYFMHVRDAAVCSEAGCPTFVYSDIDSAPIVRLGNIGDEIVIADDRRADALRSLYVRKGPVIEEMRWSANDDAYEALEF